MKKIAKNANKRLKNDLNEDYCSTCVSVLKYNYAEKDNGDLGLHSVECPNCGTKFKTEDDQEMWGMVEKI